MISLWLMHFFFVSLPLAGLNPCPCLKRSLIKHKVRLFQQYNQAKNNIKVAQ